MTYYDAAILRLPRFFQDLEDNPELRDQFAAAMAHTPAGLTRDQQCWCTGYAYCLAEIACGRLTVPTITPEEGEHSNN